MSFINKIPGWLRWILFLPVALIAAIIVMIPFGLVIMLVNHAIPYKEIALYMKWLVEIVRHFIQGYVFIWLGSLIAPSHRRKISIMLIFIAIMICLHTLYNDLLYYQETQNTFYIHPFLIVTCAFAIIGAVTACYNTWRDYSKINNEVLTSR